MNNQGWISIHRKILENPLSNKPDYLSVWLHILLMANHENKSFIWNNQKQIVREGQLLTGRKELSKKTGVAESQVYKILNYLEKEQQIEQQKTTKYTVITIVNWSRYQQKEQQKEQQSNNRVTTEQQQSNTNNNDNNYNNISKDIEDKSSEYGNKDINRFIEKINNYLEVKLPDTGKSRFVVSTILKLLKKSKSREWMDEDKWVNAKKWFDQYYDSHISKGFHPQSWYKVSDNVRLWIANRGDLSKLNSGKNERN